MTIKNLALICAPIHPAAHPPGVTTIASNESAWRTRSLAAAQVRSVTRIANSAIVLELAAVRLARA